MPQELSVRATRESGMCFTATTGEHTVCLDYPLGEQGTSGPTPLQMLLSRLAVCAGSTLALVLERMQQPLTGLAVEATGLRRDAHPTVITHIHLSFEVRGRAVERDRVAHALKIAEEQLCPVWAMLRPGTPIETSFQVVED
jgi:putative redox protein